MLGGFRLAARHHAVPAGPLRFVHRLDADTSGILLFAKSQGALETFSGLFESRRMEKVYLAVVSGVPEPREWSCRLKLAPDPKVHGRMKGRRFVHARGSGRAGPAGGAWLTAAARSRPAGC